MAFGFPDLQAKGQANQDAGISAAKRRDIKKFARPDWYAEWYRQAVPELLGVSKGIRDEGDWLAGAGARTIDEGAADDARRYGRSSLRPATAGYRRAISSNNLQQWYQAAMLNAARQAGTARLNTIRAIAGQGSPAYRMPGSAQVLNSISDIAGGVGMGLMSGG